MTMTYRPLGDTGMHVSSDCLGTMMLGAIGNAGHVDGARIIHAALDAGINFIDTADMYSAGESEQIVGKASAVDATRSCLPRKSTSRWARDPTAAATPGGGSPRRSRPA